MRRFEQVVAILDAAVGGADVGVAFHGAFWRGVTRNEFVGARVFGVEVLDVGNGAHSNLVKALKGQSPFGADIGTVGASFNRMPSGGPFVGGSDIAIVEKWIDDGCPDDDDGDGNTNPDTDDTQNPGTTPPASSGLSWHPTGAPKARRHDDVWFHDEQLGWAVNSDGNILNTTDGGATWTVQQSTPGVYLRCIGFANKDRGWVGTLTPSRRLYSTPNGGANWSVATGLPTNSPVAICGLSVVNDRVVFGSGTNRPVDVPGMIKTIDVPSST